MKKVLLSYSLSLLFMAVSAQTDSIDIETISINATLATADDPLTVQNIDAAEIDRVYIGQSPSALLEQLSPSIISYGDGGNNIGNYVQIRMRGMSQSRINMTLNGVPLNDMLDQATYFSNFSDFGNSIGSMQVHRGVGTSNNGVASLAGAVNFKSPDLKTIEKGGEVQGLFGSFRTNRVAMEGQSGLLDNGWSFYGRMTRTQSDGYKYNSGTNAHSMFASAGYFGEGHWLQITALSGKTQNGQAYLPVLLSDIEADPRTNNNHPVDTDDFEQEQIQIKFSLPRNNFIWNATGYYGGARGVFPFSYEYNGLFKNQYGVQNDQFGLMTDIHYVKDQMDIRAGIHGYLFDRINRDYSEPDSANPFNLQTSDKNELSLFGKINYDLGDINVYADAQVRHIYMDFSEEYPTSQRRTFFSPKLGLKYSLDDSQSLYLSYGYTKREPTRSDFRNSVGEIKDESVSDIELGYTYTTDKGQLQANLFYMDFSNEIALVGRLQQNSYVDIRTNVESSRRIGLELAGQYALSDKLTASLNASVMKSHVESFDGKEDLESVLTPDLIVRPALNYDASDRIKLSVNGMYVSESYIELFNEEDYITPSFFVLNAQAEVFITEYISLLASANNIFDELYFTDGSVVFDDPDFDDQGPAIGPGYRVQPPRNIYGMLRFKF